MMLAEQDTNQDEQATYDALFTQLASKLTTDGWETRQDTPPAAYLHLSKPSWGDENMDGIHFETYILPQQLESRCAPVMLHCEGGCPFRTRFMELFAFRAAALVRKFPGGYSMAGSSSATSDSNALCEVSVPFEKSPSETVKRISMELRRLQLLAPLIDEIVSELSGDSDSDSDDDDHLCWLAKQREARGALPPPKR
jgi:hypothetical protein